MNINTSTYSIRVQNDTSLAKARETTSNNEEELQQIEALEQRDREVRTHEAAHLASAGGYARGLSFNYQVGPDGKRYAVGGEVKIDMSPIPNNPEATIRKMQVVQRAALAPADPSPQDRAVAAAARSIEQQARRELLELQNQPLNGEQAIDTPSNQQPDNFLERIYNRSQTKSSYFFNEIV